MKKLILITLLLSIQPTLSEESGLGSLGKKYADAAGSGGWSMGAYGTSSGGIYGGGFGVANVGGIGSMSGYPGTNTDPSTLPFAFKNLDGKYEITANNVESYAGIIGSELEARLYSEGSEKELSAVLDKYIQEYDLSNSNSLFQDRIIESIATKFMNRMNVFNMESGQMQSYPTENLQKLKNTLSNLNIPYPSSMEHLEKFNELYNKENPDVDELLKIYDKLPKHMSDKLYNNMSMSFGSDTDSLFKLQKAYINSMTTNDELLNFYDNQQMFIGDSRDKEEILDYLASKIDMNAKGYFRDSFICQPILNAFNLTEKGKAIQNQMILESGFSMPAEYESSLQGNADQEEVYKEIQNKWNVTQIKNLRSNLKRMQKNKVDFDVVCNNGLTARDQLKEIIDAGLIYESEIPNIAIDKKNATSPCVTMNGSIDIPLLCNMDDVMTNLHNSILRNKRIASRKKTDGKLTLTSNVTSDHCSLTFFETYKRKEGQIGRESLEVVIDNDSTNKTFKLSGNDKEAFLKKLEKLLKK
ncbi:hypothetical protein HBN50_13695 [Halobacteriovorax sp. GB3]|uniref:hypothetical protein n=1 Tax=Halobacteriovorax sp. GB3 TaxID=2719615 RepID=UPI00236152C5|nr:hypothetical protein [Halobacteriovorax sp. GB3]MDD0854161.1 hypothetical protein [Halobacteriovorax sp. GB3]